jgi:hypothetical protein
MNDVWSHWRADGPALVPLRAKDGRIKAYATVDHEDVELVSAYAWRLHRLGYATANGSTVLMHRLILGLGKGDSRQADHVNRSRLDNRRANLRIVTRAQNIQNVPGRGGRSKYRGVDLYVPTGRWRARCQLGGRQHNLGYFATEDEAAAAALAFRREHMPYSID